MIGDWTRAAEYWRPRLRQPVVSDDAADLPLVQRAREDGLELLTEAPLWCFLPALWPGDHCAWVHDERVRHARTYVDGELVSIPWTTADHFDIEADYAQLLAECGVPPRPPGRVWLLRMPPGSTSLEDWLVDISRSWEAQGGPITADAAFAAYVGGEVGRLFGR